MMNLYTVVAANIVLNTVLVRLLWRLCQGGNGTGREPDAPELARAAEELRGIGEELRRLEKKLLERARRE